MRGRAGGPAGRDPRSRAGCGAVCDRRARLRTLLVLAVLAGTALAAPAHAGGEEPEPGAATVRYQVEASSAVARLTGAGRLVQARTGGKGVVRIRARVPGAGRTAVRLGAGRWSLAYARSTAPEGSSSTLRLRVRVTGTTTAARCPAGARGTVTLVDADAGDSVQVRFARSRCAPFARAWSTAAGDGIEVRITLLEPAVRALL